MEPEEIAATGIALIVGLNLAPETSTENPDDS